MTITDRDREAALALTAGNMARTLYAAEIAEALAQAREEGRQEVRAGLIRLREVALGHLNDIEAELAAIHARREV